MRLIARYLKPYSVKIIFVILLKLVGTLTELLLPYILEHLIDDVVPLKDTGRILLWGAIMILTALVTWRLNVRANRMGVDNAQHAAYAIRRDLFHTTVNLSGAQFDAFGLPSLTSRMTSDSYNVQQFAASIQTLCIRAPIILLGGIVVTLVMDATLSAILCVMVPLLLAVVLLVSRKGIPLYDRVQQRLDDVVRVMRENITGVRVIKALSKQEYEKRRFYGSNEEMTRSDVKASTLMMLPGPLMQIFLNVGLVLVVYVGAVRVNSGAIQPGVILAFLTYFNMILYSVLSLNRIFMMLSKATASAQRIGQVLDTQPDQRVLGLEQARSCPAGEPAYVIFDHVSFRYQQGNGGEPCLDDISFRLKRGESLGIIGPTGCGKSTIIKLLMRFYDAEEGGVFVDGRDVRTYEKDTLHRKFGVVFQNDTVFHSTLGDNIAFGRPLEREALEAAAQDAMAADFIAALPGALDYMTDIKGANLSGGQKQRLLIARALAAHPDILVLDDSSSALDYKTDAALRQAIARGHGDSTLIMIAQRASSIQHMTHILVLEEGRCIGYGSHRELLETCPAYREICRVQMGELA
ncbi:MAG: ABC transporter ATP-binding protein/permease [Oscillospiraceae bacterium]|nr:ABC transporter ATP-binding protein/permease [Oscillospiraceae bacterium]